jgi:hypothetical protein
VLFGFRGEIALKFAQELSDEARPPEIRFDRVMIVARAGELQIVAGAAGRFIEKFPDSRFEEGPKIMGPIKIAANRPA